MIHSRLVDGLELPSVVVQDHSLRLPVHFNIVRTHFEVCSFFVAKMVLVAAGTGLPPTGCCTPTSQTFQKQPWPHTLQVFQNFGLASFSAANLARLFPEKSHKVDAKIFGLKITSGKTHKVEYTYQFVYFGDLGPDAVSA